MRNDIWIVEGLELCGLGMIYVVEGLELGG